MKSKRDRLVCLCLILVLANSSLLAQASRQDVSRTTPRSEADPGAKPGLPTEDSREYELRIFREHIFARTLESIKKMDEPALRLSARNQILTYLSEERPQTTETKHLAYQVALDALADLDQHGGEILPFMASYLSNNLGAWIQKYRPELTEKFQNASKANKNIDHSMKIRSLFELKSGEILAAQQIRQMLERGEAVDGLFFWLDELVRRNSTELEPLMSEVVTRAKQGQVSLDTLYWVSEIYLRPQISVALRNQFLEMVVTRTQPALFVVEPAPEVAYRLLTGVLPFIAQVSQELYDQALAQSFALRASLSETQRKNEERTRRLAESPNPIEYLLSEAEAAKSKSERNELLVRAAQLALDKQRFELCLDLAARVDLDAPAAIANLWHNWKNQFLKGFVKSALTAKEVKVAEKGASQVSASLTGVEANALLIRFMVQAGDKPSAQRLLTDAAKLGQAISSGTDKAKAFFLLSLMSVQVDESRQGELLLSGIKALNNFPGPDSKATDKKPFQEYIRSLDNSGHELNKAFKHLTKRDGNHALALVEQLQKHDLKTFALIGILLGLEDVWATFGKQQRPSMP